MSRTKKKQTRAERRAECRRIVAHLLVHGYFPVSYNSIAQEGGPHVYVHMSGRVMDDASHPFKPKNHTAWPLLPTLRALARYVGAPR